MKLFKDNLLSIIKYIMVSSIVNLKRILADESSKKSKDMVMSLKVFKKLSSLMLTKADNTTIDVAVRMYHDAVKNRTHALQQGLSL